MEVELVIMQAKYCEDGRFQSHSLTSWLRISEMFPDNLPKISKNEYFVGNFFNMTYIEGDFVNMYSNNNMNTFIKVEGILNRATSHNLNHV